MTAYASFYSRDFKARGLNLKRWVAYKKNLRRFDGNITIQIEDLETSQGSEITTATFIQKYHSSRYSDTGIKRLRFKKVKNQWKIYRETWSPVKP